MSYSKSKNTAIQTRGQPQQWSSWKGDWQSYLEHLEECGALSPNIIRINGRLELRPGYNPPWTLKDFT